MKSSSVSQRPLILLAADQRITYCAAFHQGRSLLLEVRCARLSVPPDSLSEVVDLRWRQAIQLTECNQVLNHRFLTAGLPGDHATTGLFQDQSRHLRVLDLRRIEGQRHGGGQLAQVRVLALHLPERIHLPRSDRKRHVSVRQTPYYCWILAPVCFSWLPPHSSYRTHKGRCIGRAG